MCSSLPGIYGPIYAGIFVLFFVLFLSVKQQLSPSWFVLATAVISFVVCPCNKYYLFLFSTYVCMVFLWQLQPFLSFPILHHILQNICRLFCFAFLYHFLLFFFFFFSLVFIRMFWLNLLQVAERTNTPLIPTTNGVVQTMGFWVVGSNPTSTIINFFRFSQYRT